MADVDIPITGDGRSDGMDRAQLILVAGLTIAVILVALVLLLNTVIYTENLATRGVDAGGNDALEYRHAVVTGIGELIDEENKQHEVIDDTIDSLREGIGAIDDGLSDRYTRKGVITEIDRSSLEVVNGTLIVQAESGTFESATNNSTWEVANSVEKTRGFTINIDPEQTSGLENASDGFHVRVADGGKTWNMYIYENTSSEQLSVATGGANETPVEQCSINATSMVTLDLTATTLNDESCGELVWAEEIDSTYTIEFVNGSDIAGTYSLTVNGDPGDDLDDTIADSPDYVDAVYSATVEIRYESSELRFVSQVRVAPGEPDA